MYWNKRSCFCFRVRALTTCAVPASARRRCAFTHAHHECLAGFPCPVLTAPKRKKETKNVLGVLKKTDQISLSQGEMLMLAWCPCLLPRLCSNCCLTQSCSPGSMAHVTFKDSVVCHVQHMQWNLVAEHPWNPCYNRGPACLHLVPVACFLVCSNCLLAVVVLAAWHVYHLQKGGFSMLWNWVAEHS